MGGSPVVFLIAALIVGVLLFITVLLTKKHSPKLDQEQYQIDFLNIQNGLKKEEPSSYAMAIIKGDKLLDKAHLDARWVIASSVSVKINLPSSMPSGMHTSFATKLLTKVILSQATRRPPML